MQLEKYQQLDYIKLVKMAERAIGNNKIFEAKSFLTQALYINPSYTWAHLRIAQLFILDASFKKSHFHIEAAKFFDRENNSDLQSTLQLLQGHLCTLESDYEKAVAYYDTAITQSHNPSIVKTALQYQLKLLTSFNSVHIEKLLKKYMCLNIQITTQEINWFVQLLKKYHIPEISNFLETHFVEYSLCLIQHKVEDYILTGRHGDALSIINSAKDKLGNYWTTFLEAEVLESLGSNFLATRNFFAAAEYRSRSLLASVKALLLLSKTDFFQASDLLGRLIISEINQFDNQVYELLLNNIKYCGYLIFENVLVSKLSNLDLANQKNIECDILLYIKQILCESRNTHMLNNNYFYSLFEYLEYVTVNVFLKKELLLQIHNNFYTDDFLYNSFNNQLCNFRSKSDIYYINIIKNKNNNLIEKIDQFFIVILNCTNIGDTILYLLSLFELFKLSNNKLILITPIENSYLINLIEGNWIEEVIYMLKSDIVDYYCPFQEIRPVRKGVISYLSQGGRDRLKISTSDFVWSGNFLNFRRLNVVNYHLRKTLKENLLNFPLSSTITEFRELIQRNFRNCLFPQLSNSSKSVVISPLANSMAYFFNISTLTKLWQAIIHEFIEQGYHVYLVAANNTASTTIENYIKEISNPYEQENNFCILESEIQEFIGFSESCSIFIGLRSGLCDLLKVSNIRTKKLCLYPPNLPYCYGLSHWKDNNFIEYELPNDYYNHIKNIVSVLFDLLDSS